MTHRARITIILGCLASPVFVHAAEVTLGTAVNYAVLGLAGNENIYNSKFTIVGNEGISQGGTITNNTQVTITGNVYEYASGQLNGYCTPSGCANGNYGVVDGSVIVSPATLSQSDSDAAAALSEIAALTPTQTINGNITMSRFSGKWRTIALR